MANDALALSRRIKQKRLIIKLGFLAFTALVFIAVMIGLFYAPSLRINEVSVSGNLPMSEEAIRAEAIDFLKNKFWGIFPHDSIFLFSKKSLAKNLFEKSRSIEAIDIQGRFSRKISIAIKERKAEAILCLGEFESCAFIDNKGFIFSSSPFFSGGVFLKFFDGRGAASSSQNQAVKIGEEMMSADDFRKLNDFKNTLSRNNFNAEKIILRDNDIYEIHLVEGWYILLNNKNDPKLSFSNLELLLDKNIQDKRSKLEYVDLRFGKKLFFKLK